MSQDFKATDPAIQNFCKDVCAAADNINQLKALSGPERDLCKKVAQYVTKTPNSPLQLSDNEVTQLTTICDTVKIPFKPSYGIFHFVVSFFKGLGNILHFRISSKSLQSLLKSVPKPPVAQTAPPSQQQGTTAPPTAPPVALPPVTLTAPPPPQIKPMQLEEAVKQLDALLQSIPLPDGIKKELQGKESTIKALALVDCAMHKINAAERAISFDVHDAAFYYKTALLLAHLAHHKKDDVMLAATLNAVSQRAFDKLSSYLTMKQELMVPYEAAIRAAKNIAPDKKVLFFQSLHFPGDLEHFVQHLQKPLDAYFEKMDAKTELVQTNLSRCEAHFGYQFPANVIHYTPEQPLNCENLQKALEQAHLIDPGINIPHAVEKAEEKSIYPPIPWQNIAPTWQEAKEKILEELKRPGPYSNEALQMLDHIFGLRVQTDEHLRPLEPLDDGAIPLRDLFSKYSVFFKYSDKNNLFSLGKFPADEQKEAILYSWTWSPPQEISYVFNFAKPALHPAPTAIQPQEGGLKFEEAIQQLDALFESLPLPSSTKKELQAKDPATKAVALADIAFRKVNAYDSIYSVKDIDDAAFYFKTALLLATIAETLKDDPVVSTILNATAQRVFSKFARYAEYNEEAKVLRPFFEASARAYRGLGPDEKIDLFIHLEFPENLDNFFKYLHKPLEAFFEKNGAKAEFVQTYLGRCSLKSHLQLPANTISYTPFMRLNSDFLLKELEKLHVIESFINLPQALERAFSHIFSLPFDWQKIAPTLDEAKAQITNELNGPGPFSEDALKMLLFAINIYSKAHPNDSKKLTLDGTEPLISHIIHLPFYLKLSSDKSQFALARASIDELKEDILTKALREPLVLNFSLITT